MNCKDELNHEGKVTIIKYNRKGNKIIIAVDIGMIMINVWSLVPLLNKYNNYS